MPRWDRIPYARLPRRERSSRSGRLPEIRFEGLVGLTPPLSCTLPLRAVAYAIVGLYVRHYSTPPAHFGHDERDDQRSAWWIWSRWSDDDAWRVDPSGGERVADAYGAHHRRL